MLVLSRKGQESIRFSESIVVMVLDIRRNTVRIGIDAPKEVHVLRTELWNQRPDSRKHRSGV